MLLLVWNLSCWQSCTKSTSKSKSFITTYTSGFSCQHLSAVLEYITKDGSSLRSVITATHTQILSDWCTHNVSTDSVYCVSIHKHTQTQLLYMQCFDRKAYVMTGRMPTNVLGKVYSPDPDDWDNKTYAFEGHAPKWDLLSYSTIIPPAFPVCVYTITSSHPYC